MLQRRIANRYADALFGLALQQGKTDAWERELASLAAVLGSSPDLYGILIHPEIPLTRKEDVVQRVFQGKLSPEVLSLLLLLLRRGHDPDMDLVHDVFVALWNKARQLLPATVTSAVPLTAEQATALADALARRTGSRIQLSQAVDPELIAGLVVTVGDRVIDASARTTLEELRSAMAGG